MYLSTNFHIDDDVTGAPRAAQRSIEALRYPHTARRFFRRHKPTSAGRHFFVTAPGSVPPPGRPGHIAISIEVGAVAIDTDFTREQVRPTIYLGLGRILRKTGSFAPDVAEEHLRALCQDRDAVEADVENVVAVAMAVAVVATADGLMTLGGGHEWLSLAEFTGPGGGKTIFSAAGSCIYSEPGPLPID
jgi:hypothetical protein